MPKIQKVTDTTYEVELPSRDRVEIGDRKSAHFKPHLKLNRWGGECSLSIGFNDSAIKTKDKRVKVEGGKVKWETPALEFHYHAKESRKLEPVFHGSCNQCGDCCNFFHKCPAYDPSEPDKCKRHIDKAVQQKSPDETWEEWEARKSFLCVCCFLPTKLEQMAVMPNCGFNISWERSGLLEETLALDIVLKQKPLVNVLSFPIKAEGLRFSFQPFLTEQDKAEGIVRPSNVEGSYAVYHATKKNNEYMTGKAFHIYRPLAEDALGNKAWCSLHIDGYIDPTSMTITIPQEFLNEAVYPVTIDPDFGYSTIGASSQYISVGTESQRAGSAWEMPAPGGTANWIRARILSTGATAITCDCKVFINQKDSGGANIHGQIATKENLACAIAEHWEEFTLSSEALTGGVNYILNILGNGADSGPKRNYAVRFDADTALASYWVGDTYLTPESPWTQAPEGTTNDYSIYCNYTTVTEKTSSDTGEGADAKKTGEPKATYSRSETGGGVDGHKAIAPQSAGETGSGVDALTALLGILARSETGLGTDAKLSLLAALIKADSGSGVEHILDRALVLISESGSGVDTVLSLLGKVVTESGTGVENSYLHIIEGVGSSSDTGEGAEASSVAALLQRDETGEGAEAVAARALFSREPQMGAIDLARVITAAITGAETGTGAEASLVSFYQKKTDSGEGAEVSSLVGLFTGEDSGAGAEAITLLAAMVVQDTGVGVEAVLSYLRTLVDSGQGVEVVNIVGAVGRAMKLITYLKAYSDLAVYTKPYSDLRVFTSEVRK